MAYVGRARERVRWTLASAPGPLAIRDIAWIAEVSPSTALRVVRELGRKHLTRRSRVAGDPRVYVTATALLKSENWGPEPSTAEEMLAILADFPGPPMYSITPEDLAPYRLQHKVPPFVAIAARWVGRYDVDPLPVVVFKRARPLEVVRETLPPVELVVALLKFRPAAAKELFASLKLDDAGQRRLRRRLRDEDLVEAAEAIGVNFDRRRRATRTKGG